MIHVQLHAFNLYTSTSLFFGSVGTNRMTYFRVAYFEKVACFGFHIRHTISAQATEKSKVRVYLLVIECMQPYVYHITRSAEFCGYLKLRKCATLCYACQNCTMQSVVHQNTCKSSAHGSKILSLPSLVLLAALLISTFFGSLHTNIYDVILGVAFLAK